MVTAHPSQAISTSNLLRYKTTAAEFKNHKRTLAKSCPDTKRVTRMGTVLVLTMGMKLVVTMVLGLTTTSRMTTMEAMSTMTTIEH